MERMRVPCIYCSVRRWESTWRAYSNIYNWHTTWIYRKYDHIELWVYEIIRRLFLLCSGAEPSTWLSQYMPAKCEPFKEIKCIANERMKWVRDIDSKQRGNSNPMLLVRQNKSYSRPKLCLYSFELRGLCECVCVRRLMHQSQIEKSTFNPSFYSIQIVPRQHLDIIYAFAANQIII